MHYGNTMNVRQTNNCLSVILFILSYVFKNYQAKVGYNEDYRVPFLIRFYTSGHGYFAHLRSNKQPHSRQVYKVKANKNP